MPHYYLTLKIIKGWCFIENIKNPLDIGVFLTQNETHFNTRIKHYGNDCIKLTTFNRNVFNPYKVEKRKKGEQLVFNSKKYDDELKAIEKEKLKKDFLKTLKNDNRSENRTDNIKRACDKVFDIAYSNNFEYFVTFTLDQKKINRYDVSEITTKLNKWLSNKVCRNNFKYIIVPEYHKDKAIHFHGLYSGDLNEVESGLYYKDGRVIYNCFSWPFGFTRAIRLNGSKYSICTYITKYITKDTKKIFGRYYLSGGQLNRSVVTDYVNQDYDISNGEEYIIPNIGLKVKYNSIPVLDDDFLNENFGGFFDE